MKRLAISSLVVLLSSCTALEQQPAFEFEAVVLGDPSGAAPVNPTIQDSSSPGSTESTDDAQGNEDDNGQIEQENFATDRTAEIDIDDQSGDGTSVLIDEVHIGSSAAHLVFFDESGTYLGSALVTPQSQPVSVKLTTPIRSSQEIEAMLFLDDGDGEFELAIDIPIWDDDGEPVDEDFDYILVTDD